MGLAITGFFVAGIIAMVAMTDNRGVYTNKTKKKALHTFYIVTTGVVGGWAVNFTNIDFYFLKIVLAFFVAGLLSVLVGVILDEEAEEN